MLYAFSVESILAKRCVRTHGRILRYTKHGLQTRKSRWLSKGSPEEMPPKSNSTTTRAQLSGSFSLWVWPCAYPHVGQINRSVMSNSLRPHGLQQARLPCPSPTPGVCSNSCLSSRWCHPTISSSVNPFSSCLQSFPGSGSFLRSQFFTSGDQSTGASASASVFPMNIHMYCTLFLLINTLFHYFPSLWELFSAKPKGQGLVTDHQSTG